MGLESWGNKREAIVRDNVASQTTTISASTSETTIVTANSTQYIDPYLIIVANTSAATQTRIDFRDSTNGSIIFSVNSAGNSTVLINPPVPITQTAKNNNWTATCGTSTTDVRITVFYVKSS